MHTNFTVFCIPACYRILLHLLCPVKVQQAFFVNMYLQDVGMRGMIAFGRINIAPIFFSMHPYLFFNKNRTSITHVGLQFERKGSHNVLLDTYTRTSIKDDVSPELYGFLTNSVKIPTHQARY